MFSILNTLGTDVLINVLRQMTVLDSGKFYFLLNSSAKLYFSSENFKLIFNDFQADNFEKLSHSECFFQDLPINFNAVIKRHFNTHSQKSELIFSDKNNKFRQFKLNSLTIKHSAENELLLFSLEEITENIHQKEKIMVQNELLNELINVNSHEIRLPLANAKGLSELLLITNENAEKEQLTQLLKSELEKLDEIVKNVNDLIFMYNLR